MKLTNLLVPIVLVIASCTQTKKTEKVEASFNEQALLDHVKVLASDSLEGRGFGTEGNKKAQMYVANEFRKLGIEQAFSADYIQSFTHSHHPVWSCL